MEEADVITWLLESGEPWTCYRALTDLKGGMVSDSEVEVARQEMVEHPKVRALIGTVSMWGERVLKRHNDAGHPL